MAYPSSVSATCAHRLEAMLLQSKFCENTACPAINVLGSAKTLAQACGEVRQDPLVVQVPIATYNLCRELSSVAEGACTDSELGAMVEQHCGTQSDACLRSTYACASIDQGEPTCRQFSFGSRAQLLKDSNGPAVPFYQTLAECQRNACAVGSAVNLRQTDSRAALTSVDPPQGSGSKPTGGDGDCYAPDTSTFVCVGRKGSVAAEVLSKVAGRSPVVDLPPPAPGNVGGEISKLARQQQDSLLGLQVAHNVVSQGHSTQVVAKADAWNSPFQPNTRLLGDGSALIATQPGTADQLLSTRTLSSAQRVALAARNAPVTGALDWLQQGDPMGFVNMSQPMNAWSVGRALETRYPDSVQGREAANPTTLAESLYTLQNAPPRESGMGTSASQYCCEAGVCKLSPGGAGRTGCVSVVGDALGCRVRTAHPAGYAVGVGDFPPDAAGELAGPAREHDVVR